MLLQLLLHEVLRHWLNTGSAEACLYSRRYSSRVLQANDCCCVALAEVARRSLSAAAAAPRSTIHAIFGDVFMHDRETGVAIVG
jgi:hypothetical protein